MDGCSNSPALSQLCWYNMLATETRFLRISLMKGLARPLRFCCPVLPHVTFAVSSLCRRSADGNERDRGEAGVGRQVSQRARHRPESDRGRQPQQGALWLRPRVQVRRTAKGTRGPSGESRLPARPLCLCHHRNVNAQCGMRCLQNRLIDAFVFCLSFCDFLTFNLLL